MSSIFQGLLAANGRINNGVGPAVSYFRSLPLNAAGEIVTGTGPITYYAAGIPRNAAGAVVVAAGTTPASYGPGATAYDAAGALLFDNASAIAIRHQAVPYIALGAYACRV